MKLIPNNIDNLILDLSNNNNYRKCWKFEDVRIMSKIISE